MLKDVPTVPSKAGEVYHLVAIKWYRKWQRYVGLDIGQEEDLIQKEEEDMKSEVHSISNTFESLKVQPAKDPQEQIS